MKLVSNSLQVRYELVMGLFKVCFQSGMSSFNGHIRRISPAYVGLFEIFLFFAIRYRYVVLIRQGVNAT